ncbi:MAG TPA: FtsQ-type POTRA domain-containing protein [Candidatus Sulfomarinibacteraceae bacterium]|nr:FtsQ-type POTRA domain-containing protein [Candidatus Sulfomarinibacteraceae bacterium]
MLASLGAGYGLAETPTFTFARAEIPDLRWTSRGAVEVALAVPTGTNLIRLAVEPLEARLRALPGVADATVTVALPDTLAVEIVEREAILGWAVGDARFLVDREGVLFAPAEPAATVAAGLPIVTDTRASAARLGVGDALDPIDLDAATRLGSLRPGDVGSVAEALLVTVSDANGFTLSTSPDSWVAVFGLYTPNLRTPDLIPGQVRLLRSLLDGREAAIDQVILADAENGTYIPKPTP